MKRFSAVAVMLLAGCAAPLPNPQKVFIEVARPCLDKLPDAPAFLTDAAMQKMDDFTLIIELRADHLNQRQHISELRATMKACVK